MKKNYKTIGIIALLVIVGVFLLISYIKGGSKELKKNNNESIFVEDESNPDEKTIPLKSKEIVVEIKGEINKPNIYWLDEESIIEDLIKKAGGITDLADVRKINRAEKLKNHQSIIIPNKDEAQSVTASSTVTSGINTGGIVNINTASESDLDALPGIGPARARDIIKYREDKGGFKTIEDLKNIKGIGEKSFEDLKDKVTV
ncbi:helix-hairpin-helix domain-containing protein [Clostridium paraputrificum]|uniref:helix-hairpin-helix domain-containing protein n=1 Tax=Clostridium TaxID=1485 RepID=UPI003D325C28